MDVSGYYRPNGNWLAFADDVEWIRLLGKGKWAEIEAYLRQEHPAPKKRKTYAFTFTTNLDTKLEIQKEMCYSAWKLFLQKTTPVEQGEVYLEYTEQGRPHLHGWYETEDGGRIFAKTFRRCWHPWAEKARQTKFAGGFHELMKSNRYKEYASTEGRLIVSKKPDAHPDYYTANAETWWLDRGKGYFADNPPN